ncbi:MAG TPA: hypothetical protein VN178_00305 [Rubrobacter sp.]|nr:hypothetical protein [Rubrobacter sp.]
MARIKVDPDRTVGTLDRRVFGGFIEHLGRCIYGGVFDEGSPLSDERGYLEAKGDSLEYCFPACSFTVLLVGLA